MNTQTAAREELYKLAKLTSHTDLQNETTLAQPLEQTLEEAQLSGEEATQLFADSTNYFKQMAGVLFYQNPECTPSQIHTIVTEHMGAIQQGEDFSTNTNRTAQYKLIRELNIYYDNTYYGIGTLLRNRKDIQPETLHAILLHQIPPATSRLNNRAERTYRYFSDHTVEWLLDHPNLAEEDVTYFEKTCSAQTSARTVQHVQCGQTTINRQLRNLTTFLQPPCADHATYASPPMSYHLCKTLNPFQVGKGA